MFVPADRVIALGIYCSYCILLRRTLTELIFGGHDAQRSAATADPSSQGLAGLRSVGGCVSRKTVARLNRNVHGTCVHAASLCMANSEFVP